MFIPSPESSILYSELYTTEKKRIFFGFSSIGRTSWAILFLGIAINGKNAFGEELSTLKFHAGASIQQESNFLRLPGNADALALIGRSSTSETIETTKLGVSYEKRYSLQRIELDVDVIDNRFKNFDYLNFTALNYSAIWHWSYTPHLHGNLSTSRKQSLNNFADYRNFNERNERLETSNKFDLVYELDARIRLLGGLSNVRRTNVRPLLTETGSTQVIGDAGVRYVFPSGNAAGIHFRRADGSYTDNVASAVNIRDSGFTQDEAEVNLLWALSKKTVTNIKLGYRSRKHPNLPQRDFSAPVGSARVNWAITAKSAIGLGFERDVGAYQSLNTNSFQTDRLFLNPTWQITSKTSLGLQLARIEFQSDGSPTSAPPLNRKDVTHDAVLNLRWRPDDALTLNASIEDSRRKSNGAALDYKNRTYGISAQFTF
jgi:exopolysaccharide biosynthesis operon protein EpsL